jgi:hypothetical protein
MSRGGERPTPSVVLDTCSSEGRGNEGRQNRDRRSRRRRRGSLRTERLVAGPQWSRPPKGSRRRPAQQPPVSRAGVPDGPRLVASQQLYQRSGPDDVASSPSNRVGWPAPSSPRSPSSTTSPSSWRHGRPPAPPRRRRHTSRSSSPRSSDGRSPVGGSAAASGATRRGTSSSLQPAPTGWRRSGRRSRSCPPWPRRCATARSASTRPTQWRGPPIPSTEGALVELAAQATTAQTQRLRGRLHHAVLTTARLLRLQGVRAGRRPPRPRARPPCRRGPGWPAPWRRRPRRARGRQPCPRPRRSPAPGAHGRCPRR